MHERHHAHNLHHRLEERHHHRQLHHFEHPYKQPLNNGMTSKQQTKDSRDRIIKRPMAITKMPMKFLITFSLHPQLINKVNNRSQFIRNNTVNNRRQFMRNKKVNNQSQYMRNNKGNKRRMRNNNRIRYNSRETELGNSRPQKPPESRRRKHST